MPSDLYQRIEAAAHEFINSMELDPATKMVDIDRLRAARTADFEQHYGHVYMTTVAKPGHYKSMNIDTLIEHLRNAGPHFSSLKPTFHHVMVDETKKEASLRMSYTMLPKGVDETVEYEVFWLFIMDDGGDRVRSATEFIDGYASTRVAELIAEGMEKTEQNA